MQQQRLHLGQEIIWQQSQQHIIKLQLVSPGSDVGYGILAWVSITHTRRPLWQIIIQPQQQQRHHERGVPAATTTLIDAAAAQLVPPLHTKPTVTTTVTAGDADLSYYMTVTSNIILRLQKVLRNFSFVNLLFDLFHKFIFRVKVSNPAMPPPNPAGHGPIQSDSLAINFEFDIRPREVSPSIRCFFALSLVNWFSGKLVKLMPPDVRF